MGESPFRPGINSGLLLLELLLRAFGRPGAIIAVIVYLGITGAITPTSVGPAQVAPLRSLALVEIKPIYTTQLAEQAAPMLAGRAL